MPYLHILYKHGPCNRVIATPYEEVELAYRHHEGQANDDFYYDSVLAKIYDKTLMGRKTLLLRQPGTGELVLEAILSNSPDPHTGTRTYVPREYITWEVRKWDEDDF